MALYDAQVTRETKVGAGLNRTCLAKRATWGKRERVSNALFEGWLAHRRGQNQLTLMYQLSVNAEAKKGKDIHTLMDSLAHAPCSARGSCGDCTGKGNVEADVQCGWCDLTQTCEEGTGRGPHDWDCSNTRASTSTLPWHYGPNHNEQQCPRHPPMNTTAFTHDSPRPRESELEGLEYPEATHAQVMLSLFSVFSVFSVFPIPKDFCRCVTDFCSIISVTLGIPA